MAGQAAFGTGASGEVQAKTASSPVDVGVDSPSEFCTFRSFLLRTPGHSRVEAVMRSCRRRWVSYLAASSGRRAHVSGVRSSP